MKPNKGSGQKSLNSKMSHQKILSQRGVKNAGMNQGNDQKSKRSVGQDGHMNMDAEDEQFSKKR